MRINFEANERVVKLIDELQEQTHSTKKGVIIPLQCPERIFGRALGELLDADPRSQNTIAAALGMSQGTLSGYRCGRYLPPDAAAVRRLADSLAPTKAKRKAGRADLLRAWRADLMAGHIRTTGCTVEEARVAIEDVQGRRWGE